MSRKVGALTSCQREQGFTTRPNRRNNGGGYRKGGNTSLVLGIPRKAVVESTTSKGMVTSVSKRGGHSIVLRNNHKKLNGRRFTASAVRTPGCTRPKRRTVRVRIRLRLGIVTSIKLINFPGIKGSAFLSHIAGTRPGVTGCRFAALRPGLNIISVRSKGNFIVTSVPKLVRNTSSNINLKRRFLQRVREAGIVVRVISTTKARKHSPVTSVRTVGQRLSTCGPSLLGGPRMVTTGGVSTVCNGRGRVVSTLHTRFRRGRNVGICPVSTIDNRNIQRLLFRMHRLLTGYPGRTIICRRRFSPTLNFFGSRPCAVAHTRSNTFIMRNPGVRGVLKCAGVSSRGKFLFFRGFLQRRNVLGRLRRRNVRSKSAIHVCCGRFSCCGWRRRAL